MGSWFSRHRERRRRRRRVEEVMAWVFLPVIIGMTWWIGAQVYGLVKVPAAAIIREVGGGGPPAQP